MEGHFSNMRTAQRELQHLHFFFLCQKAYNLSFRSRSGKWGFFSDFSVILPLGLQSQSKQASFTVVLNPKSQAESLLSYIHLSIPFKVLFKGHKSNGKTFDIHLFGIEVLFATDCTDIASGKIRISFCFFRMGA